MRLIDFAGHAARTWDVERGGEYRPRFRPLHGTILVATVFWHGSCHKVLTKRGIACVEVVLQALGLTYRFVSANPSLRSKGIVVARSRS
jgi:hypothetical protein